MVIVLTSFVFENVTVFTSTSFTSTAPIDPMVDGLSPETNYGMQQEFDAGLVSYRMHSLRAVVLQSQLLIS